jgi:excisionase family DNA binding protein
LNAAENRTRSERRKTMDSDLSPLPQVLNGYQAARLLSVSLSTVLREAQRGRLPHTRIGRRYVFPRDLLLRYLETRAIGSLRDGGAQAQDFALADGGPVESENASAPAQEVERSISRRRLERPGKPCAATARWAKRLATLE